MGITSLSFCYIANGDHSDRIKIWERGETLIYFLLSIESKAFEGGSKKKKKLNVQEDGCNKVAWINDSVYSV